MRKIIFVGIICVSIISGFIIIMVPKIFDIDKVTASIFFTQAKIAYQKALVETNFGSFEITFNKKSPTAVNNFIRLAENGFYNKTTFHKIVKGLGVFGGDPLTKDISQKGLWGRGSSGSFFIDEIDKNDQMSQGSVIMVNFGPDTNSSQFAILTGNAHWLKGHNTKLGDITDGWEVISKLADIQTDPLDTPIAPVIIERIILK